MTTRRSFLGWLLGAAAAGPAVVEAAMAAPTVVEKTVAAGLPTGGIRGIYSGVPLAGFRGVPICVVDRLSDLPADLPLGAQVRIKLPPEGWQRLES